MVQLMVVERPTGGTSLISISAIMGVPGESIILVSLDTPPLGDPEPESEKMKKKKNKKNLIKNWFFFAILENMKTPFNS
jgi:hypothetical protein